MNTFFEDVMKILRETVADYGSIRKVAEATKMNPSTISKWLAQDPAKNKRSPNIREIGQVMDLVNARVFVQPSSQKSAHSSEKISTLEMEKLDQLRIENQRLKIELEKERAVSSKLQEIIESMVSSKSTGGETTAIPIEKEKIRTA